MESELAFLSKNFALSKGNEETKTKCAIRKCRALTPQSSDESDSESDVWVSTEASEDEESFDEEEIITYEIKTSRRKLHFNKLPKDDEEGEPKDGQEGEEEEESGTYLTSEELKIGKLGHYKV